jgi:hypothetical protein
MVSDRSRSSASVSRDGGRNRKKTELPSKLCAVCARPFTWRKKWARDWEHVKYCSKRCASSRNGRTS